MNMPTRVQAQREISEKWTRIVSDALIDEPGLEFIHKESHLQHRVRLRLHWPHPIVAALHARPGNSEFLHFVDQRSAFQAEFSGSSFGAADYPTDSLKCL